ncbi:hypothetical protein BU17DRAFT_47038 [Hysterangium stoloniferum]|nr:hypothetical protein BU17DRAFT_47038 [Hysterangium stoloniferum]
MQNAFDGQSQGSVSSRPTIRRKSSAGLLASFKAPSISTTASSLVLSIQQSPNVPQKPSTPPIGSPPFSGSSATSRDWDSQSLYSESAASTGTANPAPTFQGTSVEYLRDMVQKRIVTLTYMRNTHEGYRHWFHTILITRSELEKVFNNTAMRKRTYRFAILAMSLSNLFDIPTATDFLRGVLQTLAEFDQFQDENYKPKMRFFRGLSKPPKRQAGGINEFPTPESSDTSYLLSPHIPFLLDYHQTLLSLLDILSEVYQKIARILGPSHFQGNTSSTSSTGSATMGSASSNAQMMGPLGLLSPHPGGADAEGGDASLWGIVSGNPHNGNTLGNSPSLWTAAMGEMFVKIDGKFKESCSYKITSTLLKELDQFARNGIKDELASLDPLLRNVAVSDMGREKYDFEAGM